MPKIDLAATPERKGSGYPPPFDAACAERVRQRLGDAGGLSDFGVNLMRLPPGNWSSQRHWHSHEDEFVYVLAGELTLIEDGGETVLRAGDCAAFPKNSGNGHHMINRSGCGRHLSRGREPLARRPDQLLRHRHDERQRRRPLRPQGRHALPRAIGADRVRRGRRSSPRRCRRRRAVWPDGPGARPCRRSSRGRRRARPARCASARGGRPCRRYALPISSTIRCRLALSSASAPPYLLVRQPPDVQLCRRKCLDQQPVAVVDPRPAVEARLGDQVADRRR